jgi:heme-degrading monooxygenase HmoA
MTFREDAVDTFIHGVFEQSKQQIRAFPGCMHMELLRQTNNPHVLFTYSHWENEAALNDYRASELFGHTWKKTKVLFAEKAEAWSMEILD